MFFQRVILKAMRRCIKVITADATDEAFGLDDTTKKAMSR